jgi:hypothetical protein
MSVTIPVKTQEAVDKILTPNGFLNPPKGSYSHLITGLLNGYIEQIVGSKSDLYTIFDYMEKHPECTILNLQEQFNETRAG